MQTMPHHMTEAQELDKRILQAHARLCRAERDLALLLAELADRRRFLDLGYANVCDYAKTKLQLKARKTSALVRIGRVLPDLPGLDKALASGALGWTKARELLSVITPETEAEWIEVASRCANRELERMVAAHRPGEPPSGDTTKEAGPVRLSFSMEPVEAEQVNAALAAIRAATGVSREEVGDGALLAQMGARVLEDMDSSEAPTGERFRIVIEYCPRCGDFSTPEAEVSETHVGQALCDAEILEMRQGPRRGHLSHLIPPATRRAVLQRDHHRCQVPGCSNRLWLDLHHLTYRRDGGDNAEKNLLTMCNIHHQLLHDGLLGVERREGGLVYRFGDGREVRTTHVGQGPTTRYGDSHQAPGPVVGTATDDTPAATVDPRATARWSKPAGGARAGASDGVEGPSPRTPDPAPGAPTRELASSPGLSTA